MSDKTQVNLKISADLVRRLDQACEHLERSRPWITERALRAYLKKIGPRALDRATFGKLEGQTVLPRGRTQNVLRTQARERLTLQYRPLVDVAGTLAGDAPCEPANTSGTSERSERTKPPLGSAKGRRNVVDPIDPCSWPISTTTTADRPPSQRKAEQVECVKVARELKAPPNPYGMAGCIVDRIGTRKKPTSLCQWFS